MSLVFCFDTTTEEGRSFGIMSKPLARGGGGAAGGKWVSSRTQQAQTAPPAAPAHAAGSHGFEDSAIQERAHSRAVPEEQAAGVNFDRQTATDALSNLFLFREAEDEGGFPKLEVGKSIYPASTIDFKKDVLALVKASK